MKIFNKLTLRYGKQICVILYAVFAALAAKGMWIPLAVLFVMHAVEYAVIGYKTGKEKRQDTLSALLNCLCFGFTWWLPLKNGNR